MKASLSPETYDALIEKPARKIAILPVEQREEAIVRMMGEISQFNALHFADRSPEQRAALTNNLAIEILKRANEISQASGGVIGHA